MTYSIDSLERLLYMLTHYTVGRESRGLVVISTVKCIYSFFLLVKTRLLRRKLKYCWQVFVGLTFGAKVSEIIVCFVT